MTTRVKFQLWNFVCGEARPLWELGTYILCCYSFQYKEQLSCVASLRQEDATESWSKVKVCQMPHSLQSPCMSVCSTPLISSIIFNSHGLKSHPQQYSLVYVTVRLRLSATSRSKMFMVWWNLSGSEILGVVSFLFGQEQPAIFCKEKKKAVWYLIKQPPLFLASWTQ